MMVCIWKVPPARGLQAASTSLTAGESKRIGDRSRAIYPMESKTRSLLKFVSYRVFASIVTALIVYAATGKLLLAVGLGVLDSTVKIFVFFLHERLWTMN